MKQMLFKNANLEKIFVINNSLWKCICKSTKISIFAKKFLFVVLKIKALNMKILKRVNGKAVALGMVMLMVLGLISCKKCSYYNDIMNYYDQSEIAWNQSYEQGKIDSVDLYNQLYKIQRECASLQKQYKDCVEEE